MLNLLKFIVDLPELIYLAVRFNYLEWRIARSERRHLLLKRQQADLRQKNAELKKLHQRHDELRQQLGDSQ